MKIIKQSFEILPEMVDPVEQIAARARICYKSEDKAQEDERPFLTRIWKHQPIFEMASVSLVFHDLSNLVLACLATAKYLQVSDIGSGMTLVTGTIRAWQEWLAVNPEQVTYDTWFVLNEYNDFLFPEDTKPLSEIPKIVEVAIVPLNTLRLSNEDLKKHTFVAVKFVTNRAVSHEMVRHRPCSFLQESQRYCNYGAKKFDKEVIFIDPRPAFLMFNNEDNFALWETACDLAEDFYLKLLEFGATPQAARTVLPNSCKTEIIVYCNLREWEHFLSRRTSSAAEPSMRELTLPLHEKFKEAYPGLFDDPQLSIG